MTFSALMIFCAALVINAGSPGPSVAALVSRVLTNGFRDVFPFLAAMWLGEAIWLTLAVTGLSALAQSFATVFIALKYVGVAYLLYLAWNMWNAPVEIKEDEAPRRRQPLKMFSAGMMVTLGNPKIMVFYVALLPTIIDIGHVTAGAWAALIATLITVLAAIDLTWSFIAVRARRLLTNSKAMRTANRTSAGMMTGAAVAIATK
ncbi:LysE family translocator [Gluconacetobacter asukensis]|uniref:LysE family translocator n=1 Tax=Gluconacetobacter asukensis TaxID=1017181 RepID=A0A7W4J1Q8_9PROT|nr:LysE family translocator [Gluconacetobacter asukensis]MBB2173046.1 LysE family translocator [Gluconacetobacter asukensis]